VQGIVGLGRMALTSGASWQWREEAVADGGPGRRVRSQGQCQAEADRGPEIKIDFRFSLLTFFKCRNDPLAGKLDRISEKNWKKIPGDRLDDLEQLSLLALGLDLNGFCIKIQIQFWTWNLIEIFQI
jgi:hypothetical protein